MFSLKNKFYSTTGSDVYEHFSNDVDRNSFYGTTYRSSVTLVHNPKPSLSKVFKTINYEGDSGWTITAQTTSEGDIGNPITPFLTSNLSSLADLESNLFRLNFKRKESKYFANLQQALVTKRGRIAEEVVYGEDAVTTGASNDIERATEIAHKMVKNYVESSY